MKNSANSNIFTYTTDAAWECYGAFVSGSRGAVVCVVSDSPLSAGARTALERSFERLEYGDAPCAFVSLAGESGERLSAHDVLTVVEGLDPLAIIAADAVSAELLGRAYRTGFDGAHVAKLLGRRALAFKSFEGMLASNEEKQRAWAALKQLAL